MILSDKIKKIPYGGDYNPEQFPEELWEEDMRLLKLAGTDILTLNVFSWAALQPSEDIYDFSKLDKIMKLVKKNGFNVCLATSTAAHPAWMARKYPDILRVEFNGMKRKFGGRHNSCPNSPTYRRYSVRLASKLAERYREYDNIVAWHISNEYGGICYCENCEAAFRRWLKNRYGSIEEVNRAWNTSFWGHTFYDWEDIVAPNLLSEHFDTDRTTFQGISLDYNRFMSDSILECYKAEYEAVKKFTPDIPVTTNFMGLYKQLDYRKWAGSMDFVSWDNYPDLSEPYTITAMKHDAMRGIKDGMPFALMEQTPSVTNWLPYNTLKRPGVMRLWSYQAVAHGADTVMFFQMRRSIGACEKYHGAIIDHAGHENTRVFREAKALGEELCILGDTLLGSRTNAKVGLFFDWDNWWAVEFSAGPSVRLKYVTEVHKYYQALNKLNIPVDIIDTDSDLSRYSVIIAPVLYMIKDDFDIRIKDFVKNGGQFITTFFSGYVDESDLVMMGGYPGKLRDLLGIWVEEEDSLPPEQENSFSLYGKTYPACLICDLLHCESAVALTSYEKDFYRGMPVITENSYGNGKAFYMATGSSDEFYIDWLGKICHGLGIEELTSADNELEITVREKADQRFIFILNHSNETRSFTLNKKGSELLTGTETPANTPISIDSKGVMIISINQL